MFSDLLIISVPLRLGKFLKSSKEIYREALVIKLEHSGSHVSFLDLDVYISNGKVSANLYDKRDSFLLHACQIFIKFCHLFSMELRCPRSLVFQDHFLL